MTYFELPGEIRFHKSHYWELEESLESFATIYLLLGGGGGAGAGDALSLRVLAAVCVRVRDGYIGRPSEVYRIYLNDLPLLPGAPDTFKEPCNGIGEG